MGEYGSLFPSLPDEVAWLCVVRLRRRERAIVSCVSRAWASACKNESFITNLRRHLNQPPEFCVFVAVFDSRFDGDQYVHATQHNTKWLLLDTTTPTSHAAQLLPNPLPANSVEMNLCSAAANNQIFVPQLNQTEEGFSSYDVGAGRWRCIPLPAAKRRCRKFGCAEMKDFVYLCGGITNLSAAASRSAFRYDSGKNRWEKLADMIMPRMNCAGVSLNDKFYAVGGYWHSPAGFPEIHVSAERFDPETGEWTLLPNFCTNGLGYAEDSGVMTRCDFAVVENKRLFAVRGESNEVMEMDGVKEEWRHLGFIGGVCEMRDCATNFKIVGVGGELWAFRFAAGKSMKIYSCKVPRPGDQSQSSLEWIQIDVPAGLEKFDHVLTATTLQL